MDKSTKQTDWLTVSIWFYFVMLIMEGALRKWFLPGLSNPLLVVRDPIVVLIYILAAQRGLFPSNGFVMVAVVLGIIGVLLSTMVGSPLIMTAYGFRCNFLHIPLIYVIAAALDYDKVIQFGKWTLWLALGMAVLVVVQFFSSRSSFINVAVGGETSQMSFGRDTVRAAGTFSFATGVAQFFGLSTAFLMVGFLKKGVYPKILILLAMGLTILALMLSGSRSAVGVTAVVVVVTLVSALLTGRAVAGGLWFVAVGVILLGVIGSIGEVQEGKQLLGDRFGNSDSIKTGFLMRAIEGFTSPFAEVFDNPVMGAGLGSATLAGNKLAHREKDLVWIEAEWPRIFYESGPIFGLAFVLLRVAIAISLGLVAWAALKKDNLLPIALFGAGVLVLLNGSWAQPTTMGFAIGICGLCLASARKEEDGTKAKPEEAVKAKPQTVRRMSTHARRLHGLDQVEEEVEKIPPATADAETERPKKTSGARRKPRV